MGGLITCQKKKKGSKGKRPAPPTYRRGSLTPVKDRGAFPHINNEAEFKKHLLQNKNKLIVIDFYATWCMPCRLMHPHLHKLASKYPQVVFYNVNVDVGTDIADMFDIMTIPTFLFIREQDIIDAYSGSTIEEIEARCAVLSRNDYKKYLRMIQKDDIDICDFYREYSSDWSVLEKKEKQKSAVATSNKDAANSVPETSSGKDQANTSKASVASLGARSDKKSSTGTIARTPTKKVDTTGTSHGHGAKASLTPKQSSHNIKPTSKHTPDSRQKSSIRLPKASNETPGSNLTSAGSSTGPTGSKETSSKGLGITRKGSLNVTRKGSLSVTRKGNQKKN